ncbi:MAG: hypothetical protein AAGI03_09475, partial [Pseudomonadota bacterium]
TPIRTRSAMQKWAKDPHKRTARMLGYVLTLGTHDAWFGFRTVVQQRLTIEERTCLAFMALKALPHDDALKTAEAAIWHEFGEVSA